jgi:hypothetical protein
MAEQKSTKLCECGCGLPAPIATETKRKIGHVRGQPIRFRRGHNLRLDERSRFFKHGMKGTPTYRSWMAMNRRCNNPNTKDYPNYGGRGIRICDRWSGKSGFENFLADMGERPEGKTLDRHPNNDGHYEPGNCRWASKARQSFNKRTNRLLTHDGRTMPLLKWSKETGLSKSAIEGRLKLGWSIADALTLPPYARYSQSMTPAK